MAVVDEPRRVASAPSSPVLTQGKGGARSPLLVEIAVVAFLGWIYDWLQNLAPLRLAVALRHGRAILSAEQHLGLAPERGWDHWLAHHHLLAYVASDFYDNAIFGVTFAVAAWTWWRRPDLYRPLRNYLVVANLIGFSVFWLYPVAPPRMLPGFVDVVQKVGGLGSWHNALISHADQLAAMPSMHLAWAVWCSLAVWRIARRRKLVEPGGPGGRQELSKREGAPKWRLPAIGAITLYPLSTAWVVMATGNHYLLDVLAGSGCTLTAVALVAGAARVAGRPGGPGLTSGHGRTSLPRRNKRNGSRRLRSLAEVTGHPLSR